MKTDCFTLRMRLLPLVFSFAVVLLLMIPSLKPSASAGTPQGKGGEVIAKPTPTPKKTTAKKKTPAANSRTSRPAKSPSDIEFVLIPPGSFIMGSTNGNANEKPVHQVTISHSFYIGRYEVTQAQWQSVMGSNPSHFKDCGGNCPVEQVSWDDAQNFINKLNERNDRFRYSLPTEAEWEYACRAGTTGDYAGDLDSMAWYANNSGNSYIDAGSLYRNDEHNFVTHIINNGNRTHMVGTKQPNAFGLYDMLGNVWEWCEDWYHPNYERAPSDGTAWLTDGEQKMRVLRGGSYGNYAAFLRSAYRLSGYSPSERNLSGGVRLVAVARTS
jgi:formylglycine-generating enzyme required for sulfatase activity